jgi:U3 small nucleolar RNA-associated protein 13
VTLRRERRFAGLQGCVWPLYLSPTEANARKQDTGDITAFCMSYSSSHLLVFSQSLSLRIYEVPSTPSLPPKLVQPTRVIARAHDAPVHVCTTDPTSTYLASGSADGIVKVWDIRRGFVTHVFKGHGGVISALAFNYPRTTGAVQLREEKMHLLTASVDTRIRIFDLVAARESGQKGGAAKPTAVLEGHHSVPRGLDVSEDGRWLVSGGRDSVVLLWDLAPQGATGKKNNMSDKGTKKAIKPVLVKTFPILERVEALGLLLPHEELAGHTTEGGVLRFFTAGEKGLVRIWDAHAGTILHTFGQESAVILDEQEEQRQIVQAM